MFVDFKLVYYIPKTVDYIVVSDLFSEDYIGGAELTLDAILEESPGKIFKIHSCSVTPEIIQKNRDKYWILGNFSNLSQECIIALVSSKAKFSIIECDYKYCKYRSSHLHKIQEKVDCDCHTKRNGLFIRALFQKSDKVFFMSKNQMEIYINKFPQTKANNFFVQSSTFKKSTIKKLADLRNNSKKTNMWAILHGGSWIKAEEQTKSWCNSKNIKYKVLGGLPPEQFLSSLSTYKGIVFRPAGFDTAPRVVIESKLLGLECILNDNVQHATESWFTSDIQTCEKYLKTRQEFFWNTIGKI